MSRHLAFITRSVAAWVLDYSRRDAMCSPSPSLKELATSTSHLWSHWLLKDITTPGGKPEFSTLGEYVVKRSFMKTELLTALPLPQPLIPVSTMIWLASTKFCRPLWGLMQLYSVIAQDRSKMKAQGVSRPHPFMSSQFLSMWPYLCLLHRGWYKSSGSPYMEAYFPQSGCPREKDRSKKLFVS